MVSSATNDKDMVIDIFENLIDINNKNITDIIKLEIYEKIRFLYIYKNNYALAYEVSIQSIIIANQLNLNEHTSEAYLTNEDYKAAKLISEEIPNYKDSISVENYRDIEIIKSIIDARIAIMENDLELAERIRAKVQSLSWKENIVTTLSMGVAYSDIDGNNTLNKADEKLYISKNRKNKVTG